MNQKALRILEFDKIINKLKDHATSEPGKRLAATLIPMTNLEEIRVAQTQTADALSRLLAAIRIWA